MGRPSDYAEHTALQICRRLAEGESLNRICKDPQMPAVSTVFSWLQRHAAFAELYARAREAQADTLADEITDIADDVDKDYIQTEDGKRVDHDHIQRARLRVDARKWIASKLKPKKYGDKLDLSADLNHAGKLEVTITLKDTDGDAGR